MNFVRPWVAIGKLSETYDSRLLREEEIGAMLQIAAPVTHEGIVSLYLPLEDGRPISPKAWQTAMDFAREQKEAERPLLVACGLGISRSTTLAIATIKVLENVSLVEAMQTVKRYHPEARTHPILWQSLCAYCGEDVPYLTMLRYSS